MIYDEWLYERVTSRIFQAVCALIERTKETYAVIKAKHEPPQNGLADEKKIPSLIAELRKFDASLADRADGLLKELEDYKKRPE